MVEVGLAHRVLGARESRVQGEGARQSETGEGTHPLHTQRQEQDVNATESDNPQGEV